MKIKYSKHIPFKGFKAINLFGIIVVRKGSKVDGQTINHEKIHTKQMRELLYIPFYILYGAEWLIKLLFHGRKSYYNVSFEREAYDNDADFHYLENRKPYNWLKYLWNEKKK